MRPRATTRKLDAHRAGFKCLGQDTENAFMNARGELQPLEQACHACLLASPPIESLRRWLKRSSSDQVRDRLAIGRGRRSRYSNVEQGP